MENIRFELNDLRELFFVNSFKIISFYFCAFFTLSGRVYHLVMGSVFIRTIGFAHKHHLFHPNSASYHTKTTLIPTDNPVYSSTTPSNLTTTFLFSAASTTLKILATAKYPSIAPCLEEEVPF